LDGEKKNQESPFMKISFCRIYEDFGLVYDI